jgi:putative transposase
MFLEGRAGQDWPAKRLNFSSIASVVFNLNLNAWRMIINGLYCWPMKQSIQIRRGRHVVFLLHVHLVFVAKYRRTVFSKAMLEAMKVIFSDVCLHFEAALIEFDGERDHVHLLVHYPPKVCLSMINSLKGVSSRLLRQQFRNEVEKYY